MINPFKMNKVYSDLVSIRSLLLRLLRCPENDVLFPSSGAFSLLLQQGSHRLEKYLNIQDCLEKSMKIKFALKST